MAQVATSKDQLLKIRDSVALIGRLSDGLVRLGPLSLGIDGILSWVPGLGEVYSTAAGAFILIQGVRAGVPAPTLVLAGGLMLGRTAISALPLAGPLAADLLTAHRWSARLVVGAIDRKLGRPAADTTLRSPGRAARWSPQGLKLQASNSRPVSR
jgi:hypothetical protein